ncbi:hypothetical protein U1Q18_013262 [Sarracenia purpurea var. burkii]
MDDENSLAINSNKDFEEEYLNSEAKFISTFSVVESIKKLISENEEISRHGDQRFKGLFDDLEKIKDEFESIDRPQVEIETAKADKASTERPQRSSSPNPELDRTGEFHSINRSVLGTETTNRRSEAPSKEISQSSPPDLNLASDDKLESIERSKIVIEIPSQRAEDASEKSLRNEEFESMEISKLESEIATQTVQNLQIESIETAPTEILQRNRGELSESSTIEGEKAAEDPGAEVLKVKVESEKDGEENSAEEIGGWEFDELEKEFQSSDSSRK